MSKSLRTTHNYKWLGHREEERERERERERENVWEGW